MKKETKSSLDVLRTKAEEALAKKKNNPDKSIHDVENYLHELQVYQVELEIQAEELRRAHVELLVSRDEFMDLYNNSPVGHLSITDTGMIKRVNTTFAEMLGEQVDTLLKKPLSQYIDKEDHPLFFAVCQKAQTSEKFRSCELRFQKNNHETIYCRINVRPEQREDQDKYWLRMSIVDETKRIQAEKEKQRLEKELVNTQKEDSFRRLAGGIAHNFNNLLTGVIGSLDILRERTLDNSPETDLLTSAYQSSLKAADLGTMMLHYLGRPSGHKKSLDLISSAAKLFEIYRNTVHGSLQITYESIKCPVYIECDPVHLSQLINNLFANAVEAIGGESGHIRLRILQSSIVGTKAPISFQGERIRPGEYACIEISDNGYGMTNNILENSVTPFITTKLAGRGLGLSAVMSIANTYNGYLLLDSIPDQGTTATVYLPLNKPFFPEQSRSLESVSYRELSGKTVLCVDDDKNVRIVIRALLEEMDCKVVEASGGVEAIEIFSQNKDNIACILLDFAMPDLDGNLTLEKLRVINPEIPVLVVSGYLTDQMDKLFTTEQPNGYIQKPFERHIFLSEIEKLFIPKPKK